MLLASVNVKIFDAAADAFSRERDFYGIHYTVGDDLDFGFVYFVGTCDIALFQIFMHILHILFVMEDQIKCNKQRTGVFAS